MMKLTVATVPGVKFMKREIFIQQFGPLDKDAQKDAVALGQIMRERLLSMKADNEPLIRPITIG